MWSGDPRESYTIVIAIVIPIVMAALQSGARVLDRVSLGI